MEASIHVRRLILAQLMACAVILLAGREGVAQTARPPEIVSVCARCHGADGGSGTVEIPNLAGQRSIYLRKQLLAFRSGQRRHPQMNSVLRNLRDREIDQLVMYYTLLPPP
jgi:cytochrome c553